MHSYVGPVITVDRHSTTPIYEQLVKQLRFLIVTGHYDARTGLPSTRALADALAVSFHTVRKAYQALQREGVIEARPGSGNVITIVSPLANSQRIERGATIVEEAITRLVGLGLEESDIAYLFDEKMNRLAGGGESVKVVYLSPSEEIATLAAVACAHFLQRPVDAGSLADVRRHRDADYVIAEFRDLATVRDALPRCDSVGVGTHLTGEALDRVSRLLATETVGLVTRTAECVRYLTERLKFETRFAGQMLATTTTDSDTDLSGFANTVDLLLYTPLVARKVRRFVSVPSVEITLEVDASSRGHIIDLLPTD